MGRLATQKPYKPRARTRAAASRRVRQRKQRDARTVNRVGLVRFARGIEGSVQDRYDAVIRAIATGKLEGVAPDDPVTLWRWMQKADEAESAGQSALTALADRPGRGRPRTPLHGTVLAELRRLANLATHSVRAMVRHLKQYATERGLPTPTEHKIRLVLDEMRYVHHLAAAQGSKAAELDGVVHPMVVTTAPHEWWTADTFKCPIPFGVYDPALDDLVVLEPEVVVFLENHTGAVLSHYVNDPSERKRPTGGRHERSYDQMDVQAAFLGAALPDLAGPATRYFAGRLPTKGIRADVTCQTMLREYVSPLGLEVPELRGNHPPSRGNVERLIGMLAAKLETMPFARPLYDVATQSERDDARDRVRRAAKQVRPRPKIRVAPRDYPALDVVRSVVAEVVHAYNMTHVPERGTMTPYQRYRAARGETAGHPGLNALLLLPHGNAILQKGGLTHRGMQFAATGTDAAGTLLKFPVRAVVEFRADPLLRGVFAYVRGRDGGPGVDATGQSVEHTALGGERVVFLPRLADFSKTADPREIGREQRAEARAASAEARQARTEEFLRHRSEEAAVRAARYGERPGMKPPSQRRRGKRRGSGPGKSAGRGPDRGAGLRTSQRAQERPPVTERKSAGRARPVVTAPPGTAGSVAPPVNTAQPPATATPTPPPMVTSTGATPTTRAATRPAARPVTPRLKAAQRAAAKRILAGETARERVERAQLSFGDMLVPPPLPTDPRSTSSLPADRGTPGPPGTVEGSDQYRGTQHPATQHPATQQPATQRAPAQPDHIAAAPVVAERMAAPTPPLVSHPLLSRWLAGDPRERINRVPLPS